MDDIEVASSEYLKDGLSYIASLMGGGCDNGFLAEWAWRAIEELRQRSFGTDHVIPLPCRYHCPSKLKYRPYAYIDFTDPERKSIRWHTC
ncbi:MAG: hypothetical protein J6Y83_04835 [Bacteroidales bacterium]|nr:hypothetical protein [Bacteroidales bacterium]